MQLIKFLATIGGASIVAIIILFGVLLAELIKEKIRDLKWAYRRKHQFDKPPTAACYCVDCKYYETKNGYGKCRRGHINEGWSIADSWFCWRAEPLERDPELLKSST